MTAMFVVKTFLEIIAACLLIWGFVNEKKVVAFENKLAHAIGVNIRNHRRRKLVAQKRSLEQAQACMQPVDAVYTPVKPPEPVKKLPGRVA